LQARILVQGRDPGVSDVHPILPGQRAGRTMVLLDKHLR
jgi:hypothetical protein